MGRRTVGRRTATTDSMSSGSEAPSRRRSPAMANSAGALSRPHVTHVIADSDVDFELTAEAGGRIVIEYRR